ncbi:LysR substrate-binding domain-containing protein [Brevundimonas sp. VNH65]|uniref:LysR substrate-binding domain-containing protein n=1 Tax=Brevundimonas sp. VNH65 TaxID=3400917 RepID=UPI003C072002
MSDPLASVPLSSLRVFEAAARLRSFTRAAESLGMTQAAVSWQVKALEQRLGLTLFRRLPREVALTEPGEQLARAATEAMQLLRRALTDLRDADDGVLSITSLATLASQWLAPRLGAFQVANAGLAVRVDTSSQLLDLERENFDIGIRVGSGEWPGLESARLMPDAFTPLCTPSLAEALELTDPSRLIDAPRIGDDKEWAAWFAAGGVQDALTPRAVRLRADIQALEVAAALSGQGVALASPILYAREIAAGMLVQPFSDLVELSRGHWIAWPADRRRSPKIARFRDWLIASASQDPAIRAAEDRLAQQAVS